MAVNLTMSKVTNVTSSSSPSNEFRFIINTCIQGPICVLGLIGNIMAVIVLFRQKSKATTTIILKALTIVDSLYLICMFLLMSLRYIDKVTNAMPGYTEIFPYLFRWFFPQLYVYRTMITWLTVLLTIDRYIVVCKPLHAPRICTKKRAWIEVVLVVVISVVYNIPRFLEYTLTDKLSRGYDRTPLASNKAYNYLYRITLFLIVMYIIPLLMLLVANTRLVITFKRAERVRSQMANKGQQTKDITYMVIATVFFFFLANIPAFIAQLLWALHEAFKPDLNHIKTYHNYHSNISNVLVTLNSGINFVIYCMCSRHFRRIFLRTFGCGRCVERKQGSSMTMSTMVSSVKERSSIKSNTANGGATYAECKMLINTSQPM